jgi:hypothetical protein
VRRENRQTRSVVDVLCAYTVGEGRGSHVMSLVDRDVFDANFLVGLRWKHMRQGSRDGNVEDEANVGATDSLSVEYDRKTTLLR